MRVSHMAKSAVAVGHAVGSTFGAAFGFWVGRLGVLMGVLFGSRIERGEKGVLEGRLGCGSESYRRQEAGGETNNPTKITTLNNNQTQITRWPIYMWPVYTWPKHIGARARNAKRAKILLNKNLKFAAQPVSSV